MKIGVDACCWANKRGFGRFTRELLNALITNDKKNEYWFFADKETASENKLPDRVNIVAVPTSVAPVKAASASGRRSFKDILAMSRAVMKHDLNIFFFPTDYSYFPIFNRTRIIMTLHDMTSKHHPDKLFSHKKSLIFWKLKQYLAIRQAHLILTVSEHSKKDIINLCTIPASRIRVISEGPSPVFDVLPVDSRFGQVLAFYGVEPGERFLLYVGGISPHKNLKTLISVYHKLTQEPSFTDVKLVLAGDYLGDPFYSDYPSLKLMVDKLGLEKQVIFTGYVEDEDLNSLYNASSLLVFPSFHEGFGLPAVEAMTCGTPVVASNTGALPEVLGDAGRFFDPYCPNEMHTVIKSVLSDDVLRDEMRGNGIMRAKQFTWDNAAKEMLSIFDELEDN